MTQGKSSSTQGKPSSIVLLSGGQDSTTALLVARLESQVVQTISFDYGQRHSIELQCAMRTSKRYGIPHHVSINACNLASVAVTNLTGKATNLSDNHPINPDLPSSFVPGRNLYFLTLAAVAAYGIDASIIYIGISQVDYSGYPDCRDETIELMQQTLRAGMEWPELEIRTPILNLTKAETFKLAYDLGHLTDIIYHTHTCYDGDHVTLNEWGYGCGECPACILRAQGWKEFIQGRGNPLH